MILATSFLVMTLILFAEILLFMEIWSRSMRNMPAECRFDTLPVEFDLVERPAIPRLDESHFRFEPSRLDGLD